MRIRGFAMPNGVSFSDGKRRVTGRILRNGQWEIRSGSRWYWRFSRRQWIAALVLLGLEAATDLWSRVIPDAIYIILVIGLFLGLMKLEGSHRRFHGAEHIAVNIWEGQEASTLHPGCGSNLVLLLLPGLSLSFLPFGWVISLLSTGIYGGIAIFQVWPLLYRGLRRGDPVSKAWWSITRRWQRLFVAEPMPDEVLLACETLRVLIDGRV